MDEFRPQTFDDFGGQEEVVECLRMKIESFKNSGRHLSHLLLLGPAGTGKTSLAHIVAYELGQNIHCIMGPRIERFEQILAHLTAEDFLENDVLFIDEIHSLSKKIQEQLYDTMESYRVETFVGRGKEHVPVTIDLPRFTLIGATTHAGRLNPPLLRRFSGGHIQLQAYTEEQLYFIVCNASKRIYEMEINKDIAREIAKLSLKNAARAYVLLKSYYEIKEAMPEYTPAECFDKMMKLERIDCYVGLDPMSRKYLSTLEFAGGRPVGVSTLASILRQPEETLVELIEPNLLDDINMNNNTGAFVEITRMGRKITEFGQDYLKKCKELQKNGWFKSEIYSKNGRI